MGKSIQLIIFFLACQVFFFIVNGSSKPSDHHGLTIKLIHRDSPESPLYQPNLTQTQRIKNLILQSIARSMYLVGRHDSNYTTQSSNYTINALHSKVDFQHHSVFMAQVGIGTFESSPPSSYFLHMDTGSSLTWTQCEGCHSGSHRCFYQRQPVFPDSRSHSYRKLLCNRHPLCFHNECLEGSFTYIRKYIDGASTKGFLASETLTFNSGRDQETVHKIVFGCGFNQQNMKYDNTGNVAGMLGLGWGPRSLLAQLGNQAQGQLSYCLQMSNGNVSRSTFLRFGPDIPARPSLRAIDLVRTGFFQPNFVNLVDISVAGSLLRIPQNFFARRPHTPMSGAVIDSGSSYTLLVRPAYDLLEQAIDRYLFSRVPGLTRIEVQGMFGMCFRRTGSRMGENFRDLSSMTFHFGGDADMVVQPQGVFYADGVQRPNSAWP